MRRFMDSIFAGFIVLSLLTGCGLRPKQTELVTCTAHDGDLKFTFVHGVKHERLPADPAEPGVEKYRGSLSKDEWVDVFVYREEKKLMFKAHFTKEHKFEVKFEPQTKEHGFFLRKGQDTETGYERLGLRLLQSHNQTMTVYWK
ncbi:MAG: hypothetical protein AAF492_02170 [Verrucomicrobiota bacterium]